MNLLRPLLVVCLLGTAGVSANDAEPELAPRLQAAEQVYRTEGPAPAVPEFESVLADAREAGDRVTEATALRFLGECHWRMGEFEQAEVELQQALELARQLGDQALEGRALSVLGLLAWDEGEFETAIDRFEAGSEIGQALGDAKLPPRISRAARATRWATLAACTCCWASSGKQSATTCRPWPSVRPSNRRLR